MGIFYGQLMGLKTALDRWAGREQERNSAGENLVIFYEGSKGGRGCVGQAQVEKEQ